MLQTEGAANIEIMDNSGRRVFSTVHNVDMPGDLQVESIDLKSFSPGLYFLSLEIDGKVHTKKFIKQ